MNRLALFLGWGAALASDRIAGLAKPIPKPRLGRPRRGWSAPTRSGLFRRFASDEERRQRAQLLTAYFAQLRESQRGDLDRVRLACQAGKRRAALSYLRRLRGYAHAHPSTVRKAERAIAAAGLD